jgi:hypothetical protein
MGIEHGSIFTRKAQRDVPKKLWVEKNAKF